MLRFARRLCLWAVAVAVLPACGSSGGSGGPPAPANVAPDITAVSNQTGYLFRDFFLNLATNVSDDVDTAQTLAFAVTSGPGAFVGSLYHHHFTALGTFPVTVQITDAGGLTDSATFNVEIFLNPADPLPFPPGTIFVSTSDPNADDLPGNGTTLQAPVKTIGFGIVRAGATGSTQVVVASGFYPEDVTMVQGIDLLGGYDALFSVRDMAAYAAIIAGSPTAGADRTVTCNGISGATTLEGFVIWGANPTTAAKSSYGVYVLNCTSALTITGNAIYGGRGADGVDGIAGTDGVDGAPGADGLPPVTYTGAAPTRLGGLGGVQTGGGADVINGGNGGQADAPVFDFPESAGSTGQPGSGAIGGSGGTGGSAGYNARWFNASTIEVPPGGPMNGAAGLDGGRGTDGVGGNGGTAGGAVVANLWVTNAGSSGSLGGNGGGGGGGGAAGGTIDSGGFVPEDGTVGATGGGGGSGAGGGTSGTAGEGGGGSFGIFVVGVTAPTITGNTIHLGRGGRGGHGGFGGVGGIAALGGLGGPANPPTFWYVAPAGKGGRGGDGGHGGGAGGGAGGDVFGIHGFNVPPGLATTWALANIIDTASGVVGPFGERGLSLGDSGQPGANGVSGTTRVLP